MADRDPLGRALGAGDMGRKHLITRRDLHPWEDAAGHEAISRLRAGADARQPEETANRLLRIIPAQSQNPVCRERFAIMKSLFSPPDLSVMVSLYLLNIDLNLMQIARSRACRDFGAVAWKADDIVRITEGLGALVARDAAHRLKQACLAGDHAVTYCLISELRQACHEAETVLNDWLALNSPPGKA